MLNENETLYPAQLNYWLDEAQIKNKVVIILDTCKSESFVSSIKKNNNDDLIIIASAYEEAYFINQGLLSFSYFFWRNILHGQNLKNSFINANGSIENITNGLQTAFMEPPTETINIGDPTLLEFKPPEIESLTFESSLITVKIKDSDINIIERVWALIIPNEFKGMKNESPVLDLPSIDLIKQNYGLYKKKYFDPYNIGNDHFLIIHVKDIYGQISISEPLHIQVTNRNRRKAVIIATAPDNGEHSEVERKIDWVYDAINFQGYSKDDIVLYSNISFAPIIPRKLSINDLKQSILNCKDSKIEEILIYMTGVENNAPSEFFDLLMLDQWLDELQKTMEGTIILFNDSVNFHSNIKYLKKNQRIIISTTSDTCMEIDIDNIEKPTFELTKLCNNTSSNQLCFNSCGLFSIFFWKSIWSGMNVRESFRHSQRMLTYCSADLTNSPQLIQKDNLNHTIGVGYKINIAVLPSIISGILTDKSTQSPISNAYISTNISKSSCSIDKGYYRIIVEPSNNLQLNIIANGYEPYNKQLSINEGQRKKFDIQLIPSENYINYQFECSPNVINNMKKNLDDDIKDANCFIDIVQP
ncbi:NHL repeat containing [Candidatus Magnetomorum sp. HK-1]|nr:NHL repeat containing [Candidatus Magnetomorum sp. HK-1]